ncbi:MAG: daunorubicin ABC transporter permease [Acidobacteria bacterium]|nr:MAG: daunorubicin ABC transporter permease [Acidobacteriota bacterium]
MRISKSAIRNPQSEIRNRMLVYFEFSRVAFLKILSYRLRYFTGILTYFVNVSVYYFIWRSVYSASSDVSGYDLGQIVTYVAVGWIIRSFYFNNIDRDMAAEVMEGKIAINLIKPVDTQLMYLSQTIGESCFRFVMFTLPIAALLCFVYPVRPPATFLSGLLFAMSCLLALFIFALLNFLVGTCALQLQSILGIIRAKYFIMEFMSGLLLPIAFFPRSLQEVMFYLPFQHVSYTPLQIYLGRVAGAAAVRALGIQTVWVAILYLLGRLHWKFSIARLSIQGG